jgi:hypothetical protein
MIPDLENLDKKTEKATTLIGNIIKMIDKLFGGIAYIFKKYWILCICIGVGLFIYWAFSLPPVEEQTPLEEEIYDTTYTE